jgi:glycosyltransferase involved in cell wall biosynthesis
MGFRETGVLPVVPGFAHLDVAPSRLHAARFDDGWTNLLFVGRVIPNKKLEDVIRFYTAYKTTHNPRSRLIFVGSYSAFEAYLTMLHDLIARLRVPDVHFLGHVSNEELTAIYDVADVFVSASEHEGFCVPIVEAFYKRVPVVAFAATAVPATMDGGGVLYDGKDPDEVAAVIAAIASDERLRDAVLDAQDQALARLLAKDFGGTLLGFVDRAVSMPAPPHPGVTFDFWHQYEQAERLEALRRYRPALFRALPRPQGAAEEHTTLRA